MRNTGPVVAVLLGVVLTSTIGWGAFITKRQAEQAVKLAVIEEKLDVLTAMLLRERKAESRLDTATNPS